MSEEAVWGTVDAAQLRSLLSEAPVKAAILQGRAMRVRAAPPALFDGLLEDGEDAREAISATLGPDWVERMDRAREEGTAGRGSCVVGGALFDIWVARIAEGTVALYARRVDESAPVRRHLHALRNSLYGIRAAAKVLADEERDAEAREVLGRIVESALEAESRIADLEACG